ncbi:N-carbamoylputrescine amidase [Dehalogenimonas formicexedens]|uniref:N-carbamoylputrescine amidase n=1 Tax=Dehalogenimonas formicexedens TaxID=1839801 RepID=A0A1P8F7F7_9CHLR|nr:carbon-nitrogen hydrolase family protein [Dehalogenimonas formicexedens]APV44409.1 N-carbamoylputrescine amidase [Dehalogenimonas formicexedens]
MPVLKVALLHLDPRPGELDFNRALVERAVRLAAASGARFIVTPELVESGYHFRDHIGTDWVGPESKAWLDRMNTLAADLGITLLLATAERDARTGQLYNTMFALTGDSQYSGKHRKINIHPSHTLESWSGINDSAEIIELPQFKIGVLICADAWRPSIARELASKGAELLISGANWGERPCPPEDCWEKRSFENDVPVWVCNRTGVEAELSFEDAPSVVSVGGKRLLSHYGPGSVILLFDWDLDKKVPLQADFEVVPVS